jgi:hypothetical protein
MIELGEVGLGDVDWIDLAQDRDILIALMNAVMHLGVPYDAGKFLSSCRTGGLSSSAQLRGKCSD